MFDNTGKRGLQDFVAKSRYTTHRAGNYVTHPSSREINCAPTPLDPSGLVDLQFDLSVSNFHLGQSTQSMVGFPLPNLPQRCVSQRSFAEEGVQTWLSISREGGRFFCRKPGLFANLDYFFVIIAFSVASNSFFASFPFNTTLLCRSDRQNSRKNGVKSLWCTTFRPFANCCDDCAVGSSGVEKRRYSV